MSINTGNNPGEDSDFSVAEVIVFDYELTPKQYKCVEHYLSDKYNISISEPTTTCLNDTLSQEVLYTYFGCDLSDYKLLAWFDGYSFDETDYVWYDKSGNCYNVDPNYITGTITTADNLNDKRYIVGQTSTTISFHHDILPLQYTFFHVTRYFGTEARIFQAHDYAFASGFYSGRSGVAQHQTWLTSSTTDYHGTQWILSSDQRSLYRSQGTSRMIDDQSESYQNNRYRLAINTGYYSTEDSIFALAEVLVFDGELNTDEIKCVEKQLSDKYDVLNFQTSCNPKNDSLTIRCGLRSDVFAWYQGDHYNEIDNQWPDDSGYCRNIDAEYITGTITTKTDLNNHQYITGTTSTRIDFPYDVLPINYTLFHVARYYDGTEDIIFQAYDHHWFSGFYQGLAGVAHHESNWITSSTTDSHGTTWLVSQDQRSVYRSNGVPRMVDSQSTSYKDNRYRLAINNGYFGTDDSSDFAVAEVIVFDYELNAAEYQCVEQYLGDKYDIPMANEIICNTLSAADADILAECDVEDDIFAWYDGDTFDFNDKIWFDKSGHCRNVESTFISGTINNNNDLNSRQYLSGTQSSSMEFPYDVLPQEWTFLHVARHNTPADSGQNRIFQAFDYSWLSGFHDGYAGVAYHENWLTPTVDIHGTDWVISTDSRSLYRSNGVSRMTDNQNPGYHSNRYRLGLNIGAYTGTTYTSEWAVSEVIVFDRTLDPEAYKCMERYLSVKYDICLVTEAPTTAPTAPTETPTQYPTDTQCVSPDDLILLDYECRAPDLTDDLYTQCELTEDDIYAWYDGDSYHSLLNQWFDKSGNCRNVKDEYITGSITTYNDLNNKDYLTGTTTTTVDFPYDVLPETYTLFHVARYFDGTEGRILQAYDYNWWSGFYNGLSGVSYHENWITQTTVDLHGREWVISTDQRNKYRSDGKTRTTDGQSTSYANNKYRLTINNGFSPTQDSDWALAEIIVMDSELNTKKIKCVENYLSTKYDERIYNSECRDDDTEIENLANQCAFDSDNLFAWYTGDSYDEATNTWHDRSGNCRNVDSELFISGTLTVESDLNGGVYVSGTTETTIQFPYEILPKDYTFLHVTQYQESGAHSRIFGANDYSWFSGFESGGYAGVAHHENWITASTTDSHGTGWVISTDQRSLYRSNGVSRLTDDQSAGYINNRYELVINGGTSSSYKSDFNIFEILVLDKEISVAQYKCLERYLSDKYDITIVEPSECLNNTDTSSFQTQCKVLDNNLQPFAWYDGDSYNFGDKLWQDKSGHCRNIESQHISGNVFIGSDLNHKKYISGTSDTHIEFPYEILPTTYTLFHVTKWISETTGRIFHAFDYDWWSGFNEYYVEDVSAHHENWLTPKYPGTNAANYVKDWIISTDQRNIYRANGVFKMNNDQDSGYRSHRYRIGINVKSYYGEYAVAEVLVFDRELDPIEYKCIEEYLSDKYNINISFTLCKPQNDSLTNECGLKQAPYAWYDGDSYDPVTNTWFDNTKYCRNVDSELITNTITHVTNDPFDEMNGNSYITGSTSTRIAFPYELLPLDYTLFHVSRYYDGTEDIIFQAYDYSWLSGFHSGAAGVSHHQDWITQSSKDIYGQRWFISNDQRSLFRTNGIGRTTDTPSPSYASNQYRLSINQGSIGTARSSDFAIAAVFIFQYELNTKEYKCVESYFCDKYDKVCEISNVLDFEQIDVDNNNDILLSSHCPNINTSSIAAWYNGDSYDSVQNIWFDQSGFGRNVDRDYISGNIDIQNDFNNYKYINGSTSTIIDFPFDLLPKTYTFIHVAKYNGVKDRIFQSHDFTWTSGFTNGMAGTAYHQNWITQSSVDLHDLEWVLSTDQRNLYRSNGVDRMIDDQSGSYHDNRYILTVNNGATSTEDSDFAIAEVLIFDVELTIAEYICVEKYLALKYNLCLQIPSTDILPTKSPTEQPIKAPTYAPTTHPSAKPSVTPTQSPIENPSITPTQRPSEEPSITPTLHPTESPTVSTTDPSSSPTMEPTVPTNNPTSAPFTPTFPTLAPSEQPSIQPSTAEPTLNTLNPSLYPSMIPSILPSQSPLAGSCEDKGMIKHLDWYNISNGNINYEFSIAVDVIDLGINIELITDYLGYSYNTDDDKLGTSYVFDFIQFHPFSDKIEFAGSCSNRLSASYIERNFSEYWGYSDNPSDNNTLGDIHYLSYGPLPSEWSLIAETECKKIRYSGDFTWNNLKNCMDYDGNKLVEIESNELWINMSGRFYLSIISPYIMDYDIGVYYIHDLITSFPFKISIKKISHILSNVGINVFLLTIFQKRRIFNQDDTNDNGGYFIGLQTQTAQYLELINPNLLSYPLEYNTWTISVFHNGLNGSCYINSNDICIQFWMIEIDGIDCPIAFDGAFDIEWSVKCNPNNIHDAQCDVYLNNYGNLISNSIDIGYADSFGCDAVNHTLIKYNAIISFYTDALFNTINNNTIYRSGVDIVYVQIEMLDLSSVTFLSAHLLNTWLCATKNNNDVLTILDGNEMLSGCFDITKINSNYFDAIIVNGVQLLHNAQIYHNNNSNNIIQFSFNVPYWTSVDTIYIHAEIELKLDNGTVIRRRILLPQIGQEYVHLMDGFQVEFEDIISPGNTVPPNDKKKSKIRYWIYIVIGCSVVIIISMLITVYNSVIKSRDREHVDVVEEAIYEAVNNGECRLEDVTNIFGQDEKEGEINDGFTIPSTEWHNIFTENETTGFEYEEDDDIDIDSDDVDSDDVAAIFQETNTDRVEMSYVE